jgi:predicted amidohydrolase
MPNVYEIDTGLRFSPTDRLPMLFLAPHLELIRTEAGFRLTNASSARQQRTISDCIERAKEHQIRFVVMPEYSLPLSSFAQLDAEIRRVEWPVNSVVIAGLEPISFATFSELLVQSSNPEASKNAVAGDSSFVNICSVWIRNSEGEVRNYLQPKQKEARAEQATQGMYEGNFILLFRSDMISFAILVCFDCIGIEFADLIAAMTAGVPDGSSKDLNMLFVIQHNDHPEHSSFTSFAQELLSVRPKLRTDLSAAVAFVNSASEHHGRAHQESYGRSAIYYARRGNWTGCHDQGPLTVVPNTFAIENCETTLVRVRFREDGPSVHEFSFYIPSLVGPSAGEPKYPLANAVSSKMDTHGTLGPSVSVPSLKKVFFDWISPAPPSDGRFNSTNRPLVLPVAESYSRMRQKLEAAKQPRFCGTRVLNRELVRVK